MPKKTIVLASHNQGKIKEIMAYLNSIAHLNVEIVSQADFNVPDIEETASTFVENALLKAHHATQCTGLPSIADDSGLEVDALHGAPGVFSSRYAANDVERIKKLLHAMKDVPKEQRTARYQSVMVFLQHEKDPSPLICQGIWEGEILFAPQGDGGFGYDPIFYVPTEGCSAAELTLDVKNKLSHRGQSMQKLAEGMINAKI